MSTQLSGVSPTIIERPSERSTSDLGAFAAFAAAEHDGALRARRKAEGGVKVFPLPFRAMPMIDKGREWDPPEGPEGRRPWKGGKYTDSALPLQN